VLLDPYAECVLFPAGSFMLKTSPRTPVPVLLQLAPKELGVTVVELNYSGTGNTFNFGKGLVRKMVMDSLRY